MNVPQEYKGRSKPCLYEVRSKGRDNEVAVKLWPSRAITAGTASRETRMF